MSSDFGNIEDLLSNANSEMKAISGEYIAGGDDDGEMGSTFDSTNPPTMEITEQQSQFREAVNSGAINNDELRDYLMVRDLYHTLIKKTTTAIEGSLHVALDTQQSRPFEVLKQLIDVSGSLGKDLMNLHKDFKHSKKIGKDIGEVVGDTTPESDKPAGGGGISTSPANLADFFSDVEEVVDDIDDEEVQDVTTQEQETVSEPTPAPSTATVSEEPDVEDEWNEEDDMPH